MLRKLLLGMVIAGLGILSCACSNSPGPTATALLKVDKDGKLLGSVVKTDSAGMVVIQLESATNHKQPLSISCGFVYLNFRYLAEQDPADTKVMQRQEPEIEKKFGAGAADKVFSYGETVFLKGIGDNDCALAGGTFQSVFPQGKYQVSQAVLSNGARKPVSKDFVPVGTVYMTTNP